MLLVLAVAAAAQDGAPGMVVANSVMIPRLEKGPTLEDFLAMKPSAAFEGNMARVDDFRQLTPKDGAPSTQRTVAYLGYDQKSLYVIFTCFDTEPSKIRANLSRREDAFNDDFVDVWLDTFRDHRRAYEFLSNPIGVQADALAGINDEDWSFDTLWYSRGQLTTEGYVVWIAIPFKSLRFSRAAVQTWGIMLQRDLPRGNEKTFWPRITRNQDSWIAQSGDLRGMEKISPGRNVQFIPYGVFRSFRGLDLRDAGLPRFQQRTAKVDAGVDSKVVLKDSLVLDLTAQPDFSQVESDEPQVTVSQRFEVFFPEKRPFFLENSNYFSTPINLFFTRRIANPQFGSRLSGKAGKYSVGVLFADDRAPGLVVPETDPLAHKRAYFAVARVSRDIRKDSSVGLIYTDREFDGGFNRVGGVDARLRLTKTMSTNLQAVVSSTRLTDGAYQAGPAFEANLGRYSRKFNTFLRYRGRSNGFLTEAGFEPRSDIHRFDMEVWYLFWPRKNVLSWRPLMSVSRIYDHSGNLIESSYEPSIRFELPHQTYIQYGYEAHDELLRPKDFSVLQRNRNYSGNTKFLFFRSNLSKQLSLSGQYRWGRRINYAPAVDQEPFLAHRNSLDLTVTFRPVQRLRIDNTYLWFRLQDLASNYSAFNNHIIRSKWNFQFTQRLSARTIVQYNSVLANPQFTSLAPAKAVNADFLITYLVHPGTAVYVGYNSNLQNLERDLAVDEEGNLRRSPNLFINDSRQVFVKVSYLLRF